MTTAFQRLLFGERSLTKVAAVYPNQAAAEQARDRLGRTARWSPGQVVLLTPADARRSGRSLLGRKMEPESGGIFLTVLRAHLVMAIVGLALGWLVWWWLRRGGSPMIEAAPGLALAAIMFITTSLALMFGGLIALRPDHAKLITEVRNALRAGQWAVVAHPLDAAQADTAMQALKDGSSQLERTL